MKTSLSVIILTMFFCFSLTLFAQEGKPVDYKVQIVEKETMHFIGLTAKTNMAMEDSLGIISQLWGKAMQQGIMMVIPNKVSNNMYGLYYNYDFGEAQSFTVMVACQVSSLDSIPNGMAGYSIPASRFAVFTTPKGNMIQVVKDGWKHIWEKWMAENPGLWSNTCDLEEYDETAMDMEAAVVKIYVALKAE